VTDLAQVTEPVFGVLENVGGAQLAQALSLVERGGSVQSIGMASRQPSTIDFEQERGRGGNRRIEVFNVGNHFAPEIGHLTSLLERKELDPQIGWRGGWERASDAMEALIARRIAGKAVLDIREEGK
jgi:NADPH2:quinone reductase